MPESNLYSQELGDHKSKQSFPRTETKNHIQQNQDQFVYLPPLNIIPNSGEQEAASSLINTTVVTEVNSTEIHLEQALAFCEAAKWAETIQACEKALQLNPKLVEAYKLLGDAYQKLGEFSNNFMDYYGQAIASYDRALAIKPDDDSVWNNRGNTLGKLGRLEEAIASYDRALQINPEKVSAWNNRGVALGNLGRLEAAMASFAQALAIKPDDDSALFNKKITARKLKWQKLTQLGNYFSRLNLFLQRGNLVH